MVTAPRYLPPASGPEGRKLRSIRGTRPPVQQCAAAATLPRAASWPTLRRPAADKPPEKRNRSPVRVVSKSPGACRPVDSGRRSGSSRVAPGAERSHSARQPSPVPLRSGNEGPPPVASATTAPSGPRPRGPRPSGGHTCKAQRDRRALRVSFAATDPEVFILDRCERERQEELVIFCGMGHDPDCPAQMANLRGYDVCPSCGGGQHVVPRRLWIHRTAAWGEGTGFTCDKRLHICDVKKGSPAEAAGLERGMRVVGVCGVPTPLLRDYDEAFRAAGKPMSFEIAVVYDPGEPEVDGGLGC